MLRHALAAGVVTAALCQGPGATAGAATFGLVIGIDDYAHIPDLDGAVNDAMDIADALRQMGAEVMVLTDGAATRAAVLSTWRNIAERLDPGDRLVVTYAGHGSNESEHVPGSETDGRDETLLLAGFAPFGPAAGERIIDDEIAALIALSPQAEVVLVADACHSGTLSREIAPQLGYRYFANGQPEDDPLPPPPPRPANVGEEEGAALFLAAVSDTEKVPELMIDGAPRGALSYAFARALRGEADADGDRNLTKGEIEGFVRRQVRNVSQGVQTPQAAPAGELDRVVIALAGAAAVPPAAPAAPDPLAGGFDALPPVPLAMAGDAAPGALAGLEGAVHVTTMQAPALIIDAAEGLVRSPVGDVVARLQGPADITTAQAVIDKFRVVAALQGLAAGKLDLRFGEGDRTYLAGETLRVEVTGRATPALSLFNLASDGTIGFLYPVRSPALGLDDPMTLPPAAALDLPLQVAPPFGADHVVAIETAGDPAVLRRILSGFDSDRDLRALWNRLAPALAGGAIAVFPFHTAPG